MADEGTGGCSGIVFEVESFCLAAVRAKAESSLLA
jgi:hypothetical protein